MEFQAIILASGAGSRLFPLNVDQPKELLPICNRPLIYYQLHLLESAGFKEVIVVASNDSDGSGKSTAKQIKTYYDKDYPGEIKVDLHFHHKDVVGT